jgi:succinyl-CoA synthetase beta subunit
MRDLDAYPIEERAAREKGVTYVKLDGEVGILEKRSRPRDVDS